MTSSTSGLTNSSDATHDKILREESLVLTRADLGTNQLGVGSQDVFRLFRQVDATHGCNIVDVIVVIPGCDAEILENGLNIVSNTSLSLNIGFHNCARATKNPR